MSKNKYANKGNKPQNNPEEPAVDLTAKVVTYEEALESNARAEVGEDTDKGQSFDMADLQSPEKDAVRPALEEQSIRSIKVSKGATKEEPKSEEAVASEKEVQPEEVDSKEPAPEQEVQEEAKEEPAEETAQEESAPKQEEAETEQEEQEAQEKAAPAEEAAQEEAENKEENAQEGVEEAEGEKKEQSASQEETLGDAASDEQDEEAERQKAEEKAAKKAKRLAWVKKHVVFISVSATILAVLLGLLIGFLIVTKDIAFVKDAAGIDKAIEKHKTELVLTKDVVYSDNLTVDGASINLNGHTLTVDGILQLTAQEKGSFIGMRPTPWSGLNNKGALNSTKLVLLGANWQVYGNVTTDLEYKSAGKLILGAAMVGDVVLADQAKMAVYGTAGTVSKGSVTVYDGAKVAMAEDSAELVIYPTATVTTFKTDNYYYVYRLAQPTVWVNDEGDVYTCTIAGTGFVKNYQITFAGEDKGVIAAQNGQAIYKLPSEVKPGNYKLVVVAQNKDKSNHCIYLDSAAAQTKVKYYADLSAPAVQIVQDEETYKLTIGHVDNATQFVYRINGGKLRKVEAAKEGNTTVDISADMGEVGTYLVTVVAKQPKSNYNDSKKVSVTQVVTKRLTLGEVTASRKSDNTKLIVNVISDAPTSCVTVDMLDEGGDVVYSVKCAYVSAGRYEIVLPDGILPQKVRVTAIGTRYYLDSAVAEASVGVTE